MLRDHSCKIGRWRHRCIALYDERQAAAGELAGASNVQLNAPRICLSTLCNVSMYPAQVYGLALYVEKQAATGELARLYSEGFFGDNDYSVERMCAAIAELKCDKVAQVSTPFARAAACEGGCLEFDTTAWYFSWCFSNVFMCLPMLTGVLQPGVDPAAALHHRLAVHWRACQVAASALGGHRCTLLMLTRLAIDAECMHSKCCTPPWCCLQNRRPSQLCQTQICIALPADDKRFIPGFEQYFEAKSLCTSTNVPLLWAGTKPC